MSKGSPRIIFRLPAEVVEWIEECVKKSEEYTVHESYTVSSWVRAAIMERFDKYRRAKEAAARKRAAKQTAQARVKLAEVDPPTSPATAPADLDQFADELLGRAPV